MQILMLGWELPPHISGGLGTACAGILKSLSGLSDLSVQFILPYLNGKECAEGADLFPLSLQHDFRGAFGAFSAYAAASGSPAAGYLELVAARQREFTPYDVIHAHDWMTFPAAAYLKSVSGKPMVAHVHSIEYDRSARCPDREICKLERAGLQAADRIIAVSDYTKQAIIARYQIAADKIAVVHNVVELDVLEPARGSVGKVISFIGRMTAQKGPVLFVEAALEMLARASDLSFVMAGDGDQLALARSIVKANHAEQHFSFPGFVDRAEVNRILSGSSVYVMPSLSEPFGIGAIEAINARVPVVASAWCGFTEVIDEVVVVDVDDACALADACLALLADPARAARRAALAFRALDKLSAAAAALAFAGIYRGMTEVVAFHAGHAAPAAA